MTEYDYSPEAYEKHLANQTRVSNWVDSQNTKHRAAYEHPFPRAAAHARARTRSQSHSNITSPPPVVPGRPPPSRSHTTGHVYYTPASGSGPPPPRRRDPTPSHHRSHSTQHLPIHHRSSSHSRTYSYALHPPPPPPQPIPVPQPKPYAPTRSKTMPAAPVMYHYDPHQSAIPIPARPGETLVIVPPRGGRVEVRHSPLSPSKSSPGGRSPSKRSPNAGQQQIPLFKRLLGSLGAGRNSPKPQPQGRRMRRRSSF